MKKLFIAFFLIATLQNQAQKIARLDSLKLASKHQSNFELVKTLNELSWEVRNSQPDSALIFAKQAFRTANTIKNEKAIASAYNNIASSFEALGKLDSAVVFHQKSLKIKLKLNDLIGIADTYNNLGIVEDIKGNYDLALNFYFKALKIYETHSKDFEKVPTVLINIGIVYKKQEDYNKVLEYYQKALKIYKANNFEVGETIVTGNIGSVLINLQEYNRSIQYSNKAKALYTKLGYTRYVPYMLENLGIAKDSLKQYDQARIDYFNAITYFEKDNNTYELSNTLIALGNNYLLTNQLLNAKVEIVKALEIINENGFKEMKVKALKKLSKIYFKTNDYYNAYKIQTQYIAEKDSLFESEKVKTIYELETKYETEKKEKEILLQRTEIAEKELYIGQKNMQIIGLVLLALVLVIFGFLFYKQQILKNNQIKKEAELSEALIKIESQNKLQEQRLNISRDLHDNIGAQLTFIISSIDNLQYGFKITNDKLTNKLSSISEFTRDTINELRDTIWAMNKTAISLEDLQNRISNFIEKGKEASAKINFSFNIDETLSNDIEFTSVIGVNIYRVIQEAMNNAIKYSDATEIKILITKRNEGILFSISDNGKGFNIATTQVGNGLANMKKRANDMNTVLKIDSNQSIGTTVSFCLENLNSNYES